MKVLGLAGWSGSGKTTLLVRLIPELRARGLTVSTLKHSHHTLSFPHENGEETIIASSRRWALVREGEDWTLSGLLARLCPVDLVIVEGFKFHPHPKIEIHRPSLGKPLLCPEDPSILAVASDTPLSLPMPVADLNDAAAIAELIIHLSPSLS